VIRAGVVAALCVACGAPSPPHVAHPIANHASPAAMSDDPGCMKRLTGTIVDERGKPVGGVPIFAGTRSVRTETSAITDDAGRFTLEDLAAYEVLSLYYDKFAAEGPLPRRCDPVTITIDTGTKPTDEVLPLVVR
jgi:hypothetical protein